MSDVSVTRSARVTADELARQTVAQRRRRVWFNLMLFLVVTAGMVVLSMAQRDHAALRGTIADCRKRLEFVRDELQTLFDRTGQLAPDELPLPELAASGQDADKTKGSLDDEEFFTLRTHYIYNARYAQASKRQLVGVCCCEQAHDLYLQRDRRHVLLFNGKRYEVLWMSETEFRRRAHELGFHLSLRR